MLILPDFNTVAKKIGHISKKKWHTHLISFHSLYLGFPTYHRFRSAHLKKKTAPRLKTFATSEEELVEGSRVKGATKTSPGNRKGRNITKTRLIFCEICINSSYTSWIPPHGSDRPQMHFEWCIYIDFSLGWNLYETTAISQVVFLGVSTLCTPCPSTSTWATGGTCLEWPLNAWRP